MSKRNAKTTVWRYSTALGGPSDNMRQRGTPVPSACVYKGRNRKQPPTYAVAVYKAPKRFTGLSAQADDPRLTKAERKARRKALQKA